MDGLEMVYQKEKYKKMENQQIKIRTIVVSTRE